MCHAFLDVLFSYERIFVQPLARTTTREGRPARAKRRRVRTFPFGKARLHLGASRVFRYFRERRLSIAAGFGCTRGIRATAAYGQDYGQDGEGDRKSAGNHQSVKGTTMEHDCAIRKLIPHAYGAAD